LSSATNPTTVVAIPGRAASCFSGSSAGQGFITQEWGRNPPLVAFDVTHAVEQSYYRKFGRGEQQVFPEVTYIAAEWLANWFWDAAAIYHGDSSPELYDPESMANAASCEVAAQRFEEAQERLADQ
jgi:hypothetical protein